MVPLVLTGNKNQASCKSKVQFILSGEKEESDIRTFPRLTFQRGGIDSFVMTTRKSLGSLQFLRIWHDNTGVGVFASWFLGAVIIRDLQTGARAKFRALCSLGAAHAAGDQDSLRRLRLDPQRGEQGVHSPASGALSSSVPSTDAPT